MKKPSIMAVLLFLTGLLCIVSLFFFTKSTTEQIIATEKDVDTVTEQITAKQKEFQTAQEKYTAAVDEVQNNINYLKQKAQTASQKQEKEKAEDLSGLTAIWPECEDLTELFARLNTEEYCYFINEGGQKQWPGGTLHPDSMLVICGQEPAEVVYRRTDVSEPPVGETEFVNILETLRIEEKLPVLAKDHIIYLLELLMRDQGGEISYFVHDLDFGRNYEPGLLSDELGKIDLSCSQSLYQELVQTGF